MGMKKYKLSEIADKEFYHDEYGWLTPEITMTVSGNIEVSKRGKYNSRTGRYDIEHKKEAVTDLSVDAVYISRDYYNGKIRNLKLTQRQMLEREWKKETLYWYGADGFYNNVFLPINNMKVKFLWLDKAVTKDTEVEVHFENGKGHDRMLLAREIKEGMRVQYNGQGTFVVTKLFDQPNQEDNLCVVERLIPKEDGENSFVVKLGERALSTVPYEKYEKAPNEMSVFNQPLNEPDLAAFCEYESGSANLYWQSIAEASGYTVSLYKKHYGYYSLYKHKLYLLEQYSVERNRCWITIDNLIGNGYVAVIEAEDRTGEVIARTRGIGIRKATEYPEWCREV